MTARFEDGQASRPPSRTRPRADAGHASRPPSRTRPRAEDGQASRPAPRTRPRADAGQASVELVALLPLVLIIGMAVLAVLAARTASGDAAAAAQAGAMALIQDADPREAARAALSDDARKRARISVGDRAVTVTVRPPATLPLLGDAFTATASAHAGPAPR